jgi:hypothetical protein
MTKLRGLDEMPFDCLIPLFEQSNSIRKVVPGNNVIAAVKPGLPS